MYVCNILHKIRVTYFIIFVITYCFLLHCIFQHYVSIAFTIIRYYCFRSDVYKNKIEFFSVKFCENRREKKLSIMNVENSLKYINIGRY